MRVLVAALAAVVLLCASTRAGQPLTGGSAARAALHATAPDALGTDGAPRPVLDRDLDACDVMASRPSQPRIEASARRSHEPARVLATVAPTRAALLLAPGDLEATTTGRARPRSASRLRAHLMVFLI